MSVREILWDSYALMHTQTHRYIYVMEGVYLLRCVLTVLEEWNAMFSPWAKSWCLIFQSVLCTVCPSPVATVMKVRIHKITQ